MSTSLAKKKHKSNKSWINRHIHDSYVHMATSDGYRSRAAYKLLELDDIASLFNNVTTVVDLGAAPGSWSQVAITKLASTTHAQIIAIDLLAIEPLDNIEFIQGDFTDDGTLDILLQTLATRQIDLLLSDMSPNLSGIKMVDQARMANLLELVLDLASKHLSTGGTCVCKIFQGHEFATIVKAAKLMFNDVTIHKPRASRSESSETYLLCKNKI